jgi:hypothetical protein
MPQIIVTADRGASFGEGAVMFRERVNVADFESEHFAAQLMERIGWAVGDAAQVDAPQMDRVVRERANATRTESAGASPAEAAAPQVAAPEVDRTPAPV